MYVNDIANMLDGWTRLRVQKYVDEENAYVTVFDSDDFAGWVGDIPVRGVGSWEVTQISLEDDHIVLQCDYVEDGD